MKTSEFTTIVLKPETEDGYLTQNYDVCVEDRILCKMIALGKHDTPENYKEITAEEAEEIKAQKEALEKE